MATKYNKESIVVIRDDKERVRQSPNMYVPNRSTEGAIHCYFEIIDNSIDELIVPNSVGKNLTVTFDKKTKELLVVDDGRGIPHERLYDAITVLAASGKFNNNEETAYMASGGSFGHGLTCVWALSKYFEAVSTRDGKAMKYTFVDCEKTDESTIKMKGHGTSIRVILDPKFIDASEVNAKDIQTRLEEKSYVFPDLNITFTMFDNGKEVKTYHYGGKGIGSYIKKWKLATDVISVSDKRNVTFLKNIADAELTTAKIEINLAFAFTEDALDSNPENFIVSYCNTIKTYTGGTHVEGLKLGIQKWFKERMSASLKGKEKDLQILPTDMVAGLCSFIAVSLSNPEFRGQEKAQLSNSEVKLAVRDAVYDVMKDLKPSVTNAFFDFVKRVARGRMASKKTRKKDVGNVFSKDHLEKYVDIVYSMDTTSPELILCEGDSASNCAATARDPHNQAIYSVKKPANVFDEDSESINQMKTAFNDILDICGISSGKKCDPEKSLMHRILMLTDGDIDGDSIANGVICLFAKHCKPMVDAGMVGRILPPAYAIPVSKNKRVYAHTQREFFNIIMKKFVKDVSIRYKGKELSKNEIYDLLALNFVYDTKLEKLSDRYCCDPKFMEYIAWKYHGDDTTQRKSYWMTALKSYPDISIYMEHGMIIVDGDLRGYDHINLSFDEYFNKHIQRFKKHQAQNSDIYGYELNGEKDKSIYDIMRAMRKYIPNNVQRFKGLGELEPEELHDLCMDPDKRTVVIMKFEDYEKDMEKISVIMSTKQNYVDARNRILRSISASDIDIDT